MIPCEPNSDATSDLPSLKKQKLNKQQPIEPLFYEELSRGKQISLPYRDISSIRHTGWLGIGGGLFICLSMLGWCWMPLTQGLQVLQNDPLFGTFLIAFASTSLFGWYQGLKAITAGIAFLRNRIGCRLILNDRYLICEELLGNFRIRNKYDRQDIEALYICPVSVLKSIDNKSQSLTNFVYAQLPADLYAITTRKYLRDAEPLAAGYPIEILQSAAELLARELNLQRTEPLAVKLLSDKTARNDIETVAVSNDIPSIPVETLTESEIAPELLSHSKLQLTVQDSTWVCSLPAMGLLKGSHGLFFFSCLWNGFMVIFTAGTLSNFWQAQQQENSWLLIPFLLLFWTIGIGLLMGSIYMGLQKSMIGIKDDSLFIETKTIFGTKWIEFEPGQISSIHVGDSNMEINDVPIQQLKIKPIGKPTIGLFTNLNDDELDWLAWQLNRTLGLQQSSPDYHLDLDRPHALPENSLIAVNFTADSIRIEIPAIGLGKSWPMLLCTIVLLLLSCTVPWIVGAPLSFGIMFSLIGTSIATILLAWLLLFYTRSFDISVTHQTLTIERFGFASHRRVGLDRNQIRSISLNDSGNRVNDRQDWQLTITPIASHNNKRFTLMTGRDIEEIAAVGSMIHQQLKLGPENDTNSPHKETT